MPMSCYLYVLLLQEKVSKTLIHPVTFNIKPTEMVAIMGASGAGKSTMLDVLAQRVPFSQASRTQRRPVDYARGFCLKLTYGIKYGNRLGGSVVGVRVRVSSINLISA